MIIEIPVPSRLYRGDSVRPPEDWDITFAKQTNYGKKYGEKGPKNAAGLFFFHDHIDISYSYCQSLLNEINQKETKQTHYYLTETKIKEPLRIIDFSRDHSMYLMIDTLMGHGINILTSDFIN